MNVSAQQHLKKLPEVISNVEILEAVARLLASGLRVAFEENCSLKEMEVKSFSHVLDTVRSWIELLLVDRTIRTSKGERQ